jgi:hypothetical protein
LRFPKYGRERGDEDRALDDGFEQDARTECGGHDPQVGLRSGAERGEREKQDQRCAGDESA